ESKGISYHFDGGVGRASVYVDREKMEIVLFNLISNAIKFTPEGGSVLVALHDMGETLDIEVVDNGCGIPAHVGGRVFDRFYRDFSGPGKPAEGFGIGLFLV